MKRRVIVHNFHSQVWKTLHKLDVEPDLVVALDSHLDVFMGVKDVIESMPRRIRLAASRASAHFLIRRALGELPILAKVEGIPSDLLPRMITVVPQTTLNTYIMDNIEKIRDLILSGAVSPSEISNPLNEYQSYLAKVLGIDIFTSPPKNLMKLVSMLRKAEYSVIDVDVDYMQEFQTECYSPIENAQPGQLGWAAQTLRLIRKTKPQIITISEAKVAATQEPKSNFSRFIDHLKSWGYKIKYELTFENDGEANRLMEIYKEFYETVQKPLERKQRMEPDFLSKEALERHLNELEEATRGYFRQRTV